MATANLVDVKVATEEGIEGSSTDASERARSSDDETDSDEPVLTALLGRKVRRQRKSSSPLKATVGRPKVVARKSRCVSQTLFSTFMYGCMHGAVDQLLPASFKALETDLHLTPSVLGAVASTSRMTHALCCPVWGVMVDAASRRVIMISTCFSWGLLTASFCLCTAKWQMAAIMACMGIFTAAVGPLTQKVIAQEADESDRGKSFGILHFFQSIGRVCALVAATALTGHTIAGASGWRYAFVIWGSLSMTLALYLLFSVKPPADDAAKKSEGLRWMSCSDVVSLLKNRSFWLLLLVGTLNGMPRSALSFITMWFQYCGLSDIKASSVISSSWAAAIVVAPLVGVVGDWVHGLSPNHGRQLLAQLSLFLRACLMAVVLWVVPKESSSYWTFLILSILIGFFAGWPGVGANRPILTEIVAPEYRATVFALMSTFEGIGAALLGAPLVGILTEHAFGYSGHSIGKHIHQLDEPVRRSNALAMSRALLCTTVCPWIVLIFVYGLLHITYKIDRSRADQSDLQAKERVDNEERGFSSSRTRSAPETPSLDNCDFDTPPSETQRLLESGKQDRSVSHNN